MFSLLAISSWVIFALFLNNLKFSPKFPKVFSFYPNKKSTLEN
jgi:hypothetical protein